MKKTQVLAVGLIVGLNTFQSYAAQIGVKPVAELDMGGGGGLPLASMVCLLAGVFALALCFFSGLITKAKSLISRTGILAMAATCALSVGASVALADLTPTVTALSSDGPGTSTYGEVVTLSAHVDAVVSGIVVHFTDGVGYSDIATTDGTGLAQVTVNNLSVGAVHQITATTEADDTFAASTSAIFEQTVTAKPVNISSVTLAPKTYNNTTTATITAAAVDPAGIVGSDSVGVVFSAATAAFDGAEAGAETITYGGTFTLDNANYSVLGVTASTSGTILAKGINISSVTLAPKTYDNTTTATITAAAVDPAGIVGSDSVGVVFSAATAAFDGAEAGAETITYGGTFTVDNANYSVLGVTASTSGTILAKGINIASVTLAPKTYDNTTTATITAAAVDPAGIVGSDTVGVVFSSATAAFDGAEAGAETITYGGTFTVDNANYSVLGVTASTSGTILAKGINIASVTLAPKTYDNTTTATITAAAVDPAGIVGSDTVGVVFSSATAAFDGAEAGAETITYGGTFTLDNANYSVLGVTASTSGTILAKGINIASVTLAPKTYDNTTTATITAAAVDPAGIVGSDTVGVVFSSATAAFDGAEAGAETITYGGTFTVDNANYSVLGVTASTSGTILAKGINIASVTLAPKTYDNTTTATITAAAVDPAGIVGSDTVGVVFSSATAAFDGAEAGAETITYGGTFTLDNANYSVLGVTASTSGTILAKGINIASVTLAPKTYDNTTTATITAAAVDPAGIVGSDTVGVVFSSATAAFDGAEAGAETITYGGTFTLDNANYSVLGVTASTSGTILAKGINIASVTLAPKTYDNTTTATITAAAVDPAGIVGSDSVGVVFSAATAAFDGAEAGAETITYGGTFTLDNANYSVLGVTASTSGTILAKGINISSVTLAPKTYNNTTTATITAAAVDPAGIVGSDTVGVVFSSATATFGGVGAGSQTITYGGTFTLDNANYSVLGVTASTSGTILAKGINIASVTLAPKTYNNTTTATITAAAVDPAGIVGSDSVGVVFSAATAAFDGAEAGAETITYGGTFTLDNANYSVLGVTASTSGTILAKGINISSVTLAPKTYNNTTTATITAAAVDPAGIVGSDTVGVVFSSATATFGGVGAGSQTITYGGTFTLDNANYSVLGVTASTSGTILAKGINIASVTLAPKTYNNTTTATITAAAVDPAGIVGSDSVGVVFSAATAAFDGAEAGAETITYGGTFTLDNANYSVLGVTASTSGTILAKGINISSVTLAPKTYNNTTTATITAAAVDPAGIVGSDTVGVVFSSATATFGGVGAGSQTITYGGTFTLDNANYSVLGVTASTSGTILAKGINIASVTLAPKTYNNTTTATITAAAVDPAGIVGSDVVGVVFSAATATFGGVGAGSQTITYGGTFTLDNANYSVLGVTALTSGTINKAASTVSSWPTAASIVYGQELSDATLSGGDASGTYAFTNLTYVPVAGPGSFGVQYTPTNPNYSNVVANVSVSVSKGTPVVTWPTSASTISAGHMLSVSTFTGGSAAVPAIVGSGPVAGLFAFASPTDVPAVGTASQPIVFTPTDTANYNTVSGHSINVTVVISASSVTAWPTASPVAYGQTLASSTLTGGTASVPGSFAFTTPSTVPNAGTANQSVTFTPTDTISYAPATDVASVVVSKGALIVTADSTNRFYGQTNPIFTGSITGVTNGDNLGLSFTSAATTNSSVAGSTYDILPAFADVSSRLANYTVTTNKGNLTVNKAALMITANNQTRNYGYTNPVLTASYVGFVNGETNTSLSTQPTVATVATTNSVCAPYTITASAAVAANYTLSYTPGTLTVAKAPLTVTGTSYNRPYGSANPTFAAVFTGIVNGDNLSARFYTVATNTSVPGDYTIQLSVNDPAGKMGQYNAVLRSGILTIDPAILTGTVQSFTRGYGQTNPVYALSYSGYANSQDSSVLSGEYSFSCLDTNGAIVGTNTPVGVYSIVVTNEQSADNYSVQYSVGTLTVTQVVLSVTGDNVTRCYGASNPAFSATIAGFVNGENTSFLQGALSVTSATDATTPVGTYAIVPTGYTSDNYAITYPQGTLTVTQALLSVTVDNTNRVYGQANPDFTGTVAGVLNSDNLGVFYTTTAGLTDYVGGYSIKPNFTNAANRLQNYTVTTNLATLTVTKAALTVGVTNMSRVYGGSNPVLAGLVTGVVNSDGITASYSTVAAPTSSVGGYPIVVSLNDPQTKLGNYAVSKPDGTLTVTQAVLTVTANDQARVYAVENPELTVAYTGFANSDTTNVVSGTPVVATVADIYSAVGSYGITVDVTPLAALNYSFVPASGTLSIGKAVLDVLVDHKARLYGEANPALTVQYSGFVDNDTLSVVSGAPTVVTVATTNSPVGTYAITATTNTLAATNYVFNIVPSTIDVGLAQLRVQANDATRVYGAVNPVFGVTYTGFVNGETASALTGTVSVDSAATTNSPVTSTYAIVPTGVSSTNYAVTLANGTLTVTKALLSVTGNNATKVYGDLNPSLTGSMTVVSNNDNLGLSWTTLVATNTPVGSYNISPVFADVNGKLVNYNVTTNYGALAISTATLTVTADDKTRAYGAHNPALTVSYSGFVAGDNASNLSTAPTASTASVETDDIGESTITAAGGVSGNYTFVYVDGTMTVTQAVLRIIGDDFSRAYGTANPSFTSTTTGLVNGDNMDLTYDCSATETNRPGRYDISLHLSDPANKLGDYDLTLISGTLTITNAPLFVTITPTNRVYGSTNPTFTATYSGYMNGQDSSVVKGTAVFSCTNAQGSAVTTNTPVGNYTIAVTGLRATNYVVQYITAPLTITPAPLAVTAGNATRVYGAAAPAFSVTYSGFVNGQTNTALGGTLNIATTAIATSATNTYPIIPSGLTSTNYTVAFNNGILTVTAASLTGTVQNATRAYGSTNPVFSVVYTGFANSETSDLVTGPIVYSTVDTNAIVGNYPIHVTTPQTAPNYSISYVDGPLAVTPAVITVSADDKARVYGVTNPVLTVTYSGLLNNDDTNVLSGSPGLTCPAVTNSPVGAYGIVVDAGTLSATNYSFFTTNGTLTVSKALLTITADATNRFYGATNPNFTAQYSGFVDGDTLSVVTGALHYTTVADTNSDASTYAILVSAGTIAATNYSFAFVGNTLTVNPAPLEIKANSYTRVYGAHNPGLDMTYIGLVNGQDGTALTGFPLTATDADSTYSVGAYPITVGGPTSANYAISFTPGTLTITQAVLSATADNKSRRYDEANPGFTVTYAGFVNGDHVDVVHGTPELTTLGTNGCAAGTYDIVVAPGTLNAVNYSFSPAVGTLTVGQSVLTVVVDAKTRTFGAANPTLTAVITGYVHGDTIAAVGGTPALHTDAIETSSIGDYDITSALGSLVAHDYSFVFTTNTLTVTRATLTVKSDNKTRVYGDSNPVLTATITGYQNLDNDTVLTGPVTNATSATATSIVGDYTITPSGLSAANYTMDYQTGTLTVTQAVLTATADHKSRLYSELNPEFTVTYAGFVNGDTNDVILGVAGLSSALGTNGCPVGTYDITVATNALSATNYSFSPVVGTLTVGQNVLTVAVDAKTRAFGAANPTLTAVLTGFVNGDTASAVTGTPSLHTDAAATSPIGDYDITSDLGSLSAHDYSFVFTTNKLTVTRATLTVKANNATREYGVANPAFTADITGYQNSDNDGILTGTLTNTTSANLLSNVGPYAITPSGVSAANYTMDFQNGTLTVTAIPLTITASNATRQFGSANPTLTGNIVGLRNSDAITATYSSGTDQTSRASHYPIVPTLVDPQTRALNYTITYVNGSLTVNPLLRLTTGSGFYVIGNDPINIDPNAMADEGGSLALAGGTLSVTILTNGVSSDELVIQPEGDDAGQINVQGTNITYEGIKVATYTGGNGTNPINVIFNTNATALAATELLHTITFATESTNTASRSLQITLATDGTSTTATRQLVLDRPPTSDDTVVYCEQNTAGFSIPFTLVLTNSHDLDNDRLSISLFTRRSSAGFNVQLTSTNFIYQPAQNYVGNDVFVCLVSDGRGGESLAFVRVTVTPTGRLTITTTDGAASVSMTGTPGYTYMIQASPNLQDWTNLGTAVAGQNGVISILDNEAKTMPMRFYRAVTQ